MEQNAQIALAISDFAYLMETGIIRLAGSAAEVEGKPMGAGNLFGNLTQVALLIPHDTSGAHLRAQPATTSGRLAADQTCFPSRAPQALHIQSYRPPNNRLRAARTLE